MDLCGRYIVAYRLGTEINATLVSDTVRDAFAHEKGKVADGLLLHSDQGCQYTSEEYFALTQEYHFAASMFRRGCPYDNALMEILWNIQDRMPLQMQTYNRRAGSTAGR